MNAEQLARSGVQVEAAVASTINAELKVGNVIAARAAGTLLFGLKPHDAATVAMAVAFLAGVALLASYVPARRAARLDPMVALRDE